MKKEILLDEIKFLRDKINSLNYIVYRLESEISYKNMKIDFLENQLHVERGVK